MFACRDKSLGFCAEDALQGFHGQNSHGTPCTFCRTENLNTGGKISAPSESMKKRPTQFVLKNLFHVYTHRPPSCYLLKNLVPSKHCGLGNTIHSSLYSH